METKEDQAEEVLVQAPHMSDAQRKAMEVAEAARETDTTFPSFSRQLFMGTFNKSMLHPFPEQSAEDKKIGDALIDEVSRYLKAQLDPEKVDETRTIPQEVIQELIRMGLFSMKIPKAYGGLGFSQVNYNRIIMAVASHCASTAVLLSAHQSIGVPQPLKMFGTEAQKKKYLSMISQGAISAFALTEPEVGSDPAQMGMEAILSDDGSHYILNGEKLWCTNGPIAQLLVVMAKTKPKLVAGKEKKQITAFIVEGDTPGIKTIHRCDFMGIRGIQNGLIRFTNVRVPAENVIWGEGRGLALALRTLNTGRLTLPAACTALAKRCLSIARRWGKARVQWGQPVGLHEAGADKVASIASMTLALEAVTWITSQWADQGNIDIRSEAAMAKLFSSEAAWNIANLTLQLRGGRGYEKASSLKARGEEPMPVERMVRDARINTIIEGTSEIMHLFLAREALDPHLKHAGDLLKKGSPLGAKVKAACRLIGFYTKWYAGQWIKGLYSSSHGDMGALASQYRYIESTSHRLARTLFQKMIRYKAGLERKQLLLGHLVDIGMELFAMAATCSYAIKLERSGQEAGSVIDLAEHFCSSSRKRIADHFKALSEKSTLTRQLAQHTLEGQLQWLEKGIIE